MGTQTPPVAGGGQGAPPAAGGAGPATSPTTLNPGAQHPFSSDPFPLIAPPAGPGSAYNNFLPSILANPFLSGINTAAQAGTAAGMALPNAAGFHSALYGPGMTPMEQAFLSSGAELGMRGLNTALNRVDAQFENAPMHSAQAPAMFDAANQFAAQMMNTAGQMGTQRQSLAAQSMPFTFGFPMQASQHAQDSAAGLLGMATQGMFGDLNYASSLYNGYPMLSPAIVQNTGGGGGKGK